MVIDISPFFGVLIFVVVALYVWRVTARKDY